MTPNSSCNFLVTALSATGLAGQTPGSPAMHFQVGMADNYNVYPDDSTGSKDVADTKSSRIGLMRMQTYCKVTGTCVDSDKTFEVTTPTYISSSGGGVKEWRDGDDVCGDNGTINTVEGSCDA